MDSQEKESVASLSDSSRRAKRPRNYQVAPPLDDSASSISSAEFEITEEDFILARCLVFLSCGLTVAAVASPPEALSNTNGGGSIWKCPSGDAESACTFECKTCSKCFPSFQALGGHRASHKKPKLSAAAETKKAMIQEDEPPIRRITLSDRITTSEKSNRQGKIHKCSICGSEFSSGQGLGGHMRRHKPSSVVFSPEIQEMWKMGSSPLSLDLTLRMPRCDEEAHSGGTVPPMSPPVFNSHRDRLFIFRASASSPLDC